MTLRHAFGALAVILCACHAPAEPQIVQFAITPDSGVLCMLHPGKDGLGVMEPALSVSRVHGDSALYRTLPGAVSHCGPLLRQLGITLTDFGVHDGTWRLGKDRPKVRSSA